MSDTRATVPPSKMVVAVRDGVLVGPQSVLVDGEGRAWVRLNELNGWAQMEGDAHDMTADEIAELMQKDHNEGQQRDPVSGNVIPFRLPTPTRKED